MSHNAHKRVASAMLAFGLVMVLARNGVAQRSGVQDACNRAAARECYARGLRLVQKSLKASGGRAELMDSTALSTLRSACHAGEPNACDLIGTLLSVPGVQKASERAGASDSIVPELVESVEWVRKACHSPVKAVGSACASLGDAYRFGIGIPINVDSAFTMYDRGCHLGEATACARVGIMLNDRAGPATESDQEILAHFDTACMRGSPYGCGRYARWTDVRMSNSGDRHSPAARQEAARVLALWRDSCDKQEWLSCNNIGYAFETDIYFPKPNADSADYYFRAACAGIRPYSDSLILVDNEFVPSDSVWRGDGYACRNIGNGYLEAAPPRRAKPDTAKAVAFFRIGCFLFENRACARWAEYGFDLFKSDSTHPQALRPHYAFFQASVACRLDSPEGCNTAAWLLRQEKLRNLPLSVQLYAQACDLGYGWSCYQAGNVDTRDLGHRENGVKWFRRACNRDIGEACEALAVLLEERHAASDELTLPLHERACDLDQVDGCWNARRIHRDRRNEMEEGLYRAKACRLNASYCKKEVGN